MQHFTKQIKTDWGLFTFYFNRIYTVDGIRYHVSFNDKNRKVIIFHMQLQSGVWKFANSENFPEWLQKLETQISDIIQQNRTTD